MASMSERWESGEGGTSVRSWGSPVVVEKGLGVVVKARVAVLLFGW